ncbi:hypothetical protein E1A91_A11G188600v1 [Gossypium mustelinum]|uniref:MLO-like protein n=1 Tax=Gossypium mustelinum TaxID=34275 RepID=A0A5D2X7S2_GOSMU|nr:hypothetical protein E1A91_A11G188600v1 [Gossypium mustelinum]
MEEGEAVVREGKSLEETPTWAVATVITVMICFGFLVHHALKNFGQWLERTKRKSLLAALEKIKEELMLFGVLSLLMGHWISFFAKICIKSSALDSRFYPCAKSSHRNSEHAVKLNTNSTVFRGKKLVTMHHGYCPEGKDSFASHESLEQLHHFVFVLGITHVSYSFIAIALAMIKIYSWRTWENHAKAVADQYLQESSPGEVGPRMKRLTTFISHHGSHPWSQSRVFVWLLCFTRQFWSSINFSDYTALRLGFITTHELPFTYDFHNYMVRSMEEEFRDIVGISVPFWIYCILCVFLDFHGTNLYFWLSFLPAILILLIGMKLHRVVVKLAVEIRENDPSEGFHKFNLRDELFWFGRPRFLLRLIQLISFQNAFEMASFLWSLWEIKDPSCFMENRAFLATRLAFGIISQCWCSFITFPLYVIVTQMGSKFRSAIISENVRHSLSKWKRRVREKHGPFLRESLSTSSLDSMATDINKGDSHGKRGPTDKDAASPSQQQEGSAAMQEPSPSSSSSHKGKLKLKSPQLNFSFEECSPNSDGTNADNNDDRFDVEDEIHCIEP